MLRANWKPHKCDSNAHFVINRVCMLLRQSIICLHVEAFSYTRACFVSSVGDKASVSSSQWLQANWLQYEYALASSKQSHRHLFGGANKVIQKHSSCTAACSLLLFFFSLINSKAFLRIVYHPIVFGKRTKMFFTEEKRKYHVDTCYCFECVYTLFVVQTMDADPIMLVFVSSIIFFFQHAISTIFIHR